MEENTALTFELGILPSLRLRTAYLSVSIITRMKMKRRYS